MTLKTAVIGVGALGRHHARILAGLPNVDLIGVVDSNGEQGKSVAAACGTSWYADGEQLLDQVEAVSVVVPTIAHLAVASPFLKRGIGVLVEKPIASSVTEARELVQLAEVGDCTLQIGHIERFNPAMVAAREKISNPKYIKAERVSPYTFRSTDIGVVLDLMIHDIDLVLSMVKSPIASIEAFGASVFGEREDIAQARLRFQNGCIADLTASRVNPTAARTMQVWSESGCTNIDLGGRDVTRFVPGSALLSGKHSKTNPTSIAERNELMQSVFGDFIKSEHLPIAETDALTAELTEFVECVSLKREPTVSGLDGLAAIDVADLILQNVAAHCWDGTPAGRVGPSLLPPRIKAA